MRCPSCGADAEANVRFCTRCGTSFISSPPLSTLSGGSAVTEDYAYGNNVGERLDLPDPTVATRGRGTTGMEYKIVGTTMQAVIMELDPGETVFSESGSMAWMSGNITMNTSGRGGGLGGMFKRAISGESLFMVEYTSQGDKGIVSFAADFPGKIVPVHLGPGQEMIAQKDAFLCGEKTITTDIHFRRNLGSGMFGGEGFILQKLTGPGVAFVSLDGEIIEYTLEAGQMMKVDTGCVAMFEPTVSYDIEMIKGFKNMLFGGEGLFLSTLRGPGRIWLQTMPMMNLAKAIAPFLPASGSGGGGNSGGGLGGMFNT